MLDLLDAGNRGAIIAYLVTEHRGEVYEALYRRAEAAGSTIHTHIIEAWKANHLEEVKPIADGGMRPSMVPLYRIKGEPMAKSDDGPTGDCPGGLTWDSCHADDCGVKEDGTGCALGGALAAHVAAIAGAKGDESDEG